MTRKSPIYLIVALISTIIASACNEKSDDPVTVTETYANTAITSFSLQKDDSVLAHLDSVFFSIDLVGARIFNADSLPKGTDVSRLLVSVGTSSAKSCNLTFRIPNTSRDTTINIIDSPNDSINFANGPVLMEVTSYDGMAKRTYEVKVNVHQSIPDTLKWDNFEGRPLPSTLSGVKYQKTVLFNGKAYCFTSDGVAASLSTTTTPFEESSWVKNATTLPSGTIVNSIEATTEAFYLINADHDLYTSPDGFTWTSTGVKMDHIYGGFGSKLIGARQDADGWKQVTYPASEEKLLPSGCPIEGTSNLVAYETKWSSSPMAITLGGRKADGTLTGEAWVFDGNSWNQLSTTGLNGIEGVTVFPYMTIRTNSTNWKVSERSALIALGGKNGSDNATKVVYVSYDFGITWAIADDYLQLPEEIKPFYGAQTLIFDTTLPVSRVSKPIEEWVCPFIYLFGGYSSNGTLINGLQRGVINRYTFKPVY